MILAHADRARIIADEHRSRVVLPNLRVLPTFLVDGFVAGTWKIERKKALATLVVEPFTALSKKVCDELDKEGNALVRFVEEDAQAFEVRFMKPGPDGAAIGQVKATKKRAAGKPRVKEKG